MHALRGVETIAALGCSVLLTACASDDSQWLDHASLMIHPSQHQAGVSYSFGAENAPHEETAALAAGGIAATIAAAAVVQDGPLPTMDTMDFRSGRIYIHRARRR